MNMIKKQDAPLAPLDESAAVLSMITRAASDPSVDIDKMERLMQMHERAQTRQSRQAFDDAMSQMQPDLPVIGERGDAAGRYTFALWEDIQKAIKPVLQRHGFSLTFRVQTDPHITVTGVLAHRMGHREETTMTLPADPSGNKNAVQAVASSVSYGKRYTAGALLNLTSHGEDDDAYATAAQLITEEQEASLRDRLDACGANLPAFLKFLKVEGLSAIKSKDYAKAVAAVEAKEKAARK